MIFFLELVLMNVVIFLWVLFVVLSVGLIERNLGNFVWYCVIFFFKEVNVVVVGVLEIVGRDGVVVWELIGMWVVYVVIGVFIDVVDFIVWVFWCKVVVNDVVKEDGKDVDIVVVWM